MKRYSTLPKQVSLMLLVTALTLLLYPLAGKAVPQGGNGSRHPHSSGANLLKALQQEERNTRSPLTGNVPKYKLFEARKAADALKTAQTSFTSGTLGNLPLVWNERGPNNIGGRTRAILPDLNDTTKKTVWAGSVSGGLWKTTDITAATPVWKPQTDFFTNMAITTIVQNKTSPNLIYFGTGEGWNNVDAAQGDGIWKSADGGATWAQLAATHANAANTSFRFIQKLLDYTVNTTEYLFAATLSGGLARSTDGGVTWHNMLSPTVGGVVVREIADVDRAPDGTLYAAVGVTARGGIFKSADNGTTWVQLTSGLPSAGYLRIKLACAPSNANIVYALVADGIAGTCMGIYRTSNAGASWKAVTNPTQAADGSNFAGNQAWYALAAAVDPLNPNRIIVGGYELFGSADGGTTWTQLSGDDNNPQPQNVHVDHQTIVFDPRTSSNAFFGNDGGIYYTNTATATIPNIINKNTGYNVTQFYESAITPTLGQEYYLAGAQDNSSLRLTSPGIGPGVEVTGGDGAYAHIDQDQPNIQTTAYTNGDYYVSNNSFATLTEINFGANVGQFINATDYDSRDNTLYGGDVTGKYHMIKNVGSTNTTAVITSNFTDLVNAVRVSPNTAKRVFFGCNDGTIYRVDNANAASPTVTQINAGSAMPAGSVSGIAVEKGNDNHIVVTFSNWDVPHVWETKDGGTTWVNISGNLPNMPVWSICFKPFTNTTVLIGTELGVWMAALNGTGTAWQESNTGLARVRTNWVDFRPSDGSLMAATHGRGLYTSTSFASIPIQFVDASYKINKTDAANAANCKKYIDVALPVQLTENIIGSATIQVTPTSKLVAGVDYDVLNSGLLTFTAAGKQNAMLRVYNTANNNITDTITLTLTLTNPAATNAAITSNANLAKRLVIINDNNNAAPLSVARAQVLYGTSTDAVTPFSGDADGAKLRNVYLAAELKAGGLVAGKPINALAYNVTSKNSTSPFYSYTVKMANVQASVLNEYKDGTGFVTVYTGDYSVKTGLNTLKFSTPFVWDGTSNIIIETCFDNSSVTSNAPSPDLVTGVLGKTNRDFLTVVTGSSGCSITQGITGSSYSDGFVPTIYLTQNSVMPVQVTSNKTTVLPRAVYGNRTVYYYFDNIASTITGSITNSSTAALGCVNLLVDRPGTGNNMAFNNYTISNFLAAKTFLLTDSTASTIKVPYSISLYYSKGEIARWMQQSGKAIKDLRLVQVTGLPVNKVTPATPYKANVRILVPVITSYNDTGYIVTAALDTVPTVSGFGIGAAVATQFTGTGLYGQAVNGITQLQWTTVNEPANAVFDVEKSADGRTFTPIGHVTGNSLGNNYRFEDATASQQQTYYRIKLAAPDITDAYTDTVMVTSNLNGKMAGIQPNPFTNTVTVHFAPALHGLALITMYDVSGRKVYQGQHNVQGTATFNPGSIGRGTYLVTIFINNRLYNLKAIKQ